MASAAESSKLMSLFQSYYKDAYGINYRLNRNKAKWAARDLLDSYGLDDCVQALAWAIYVKTEPFTWEWYAGNVDRLLKAYEDAYKDLDLRKQRRQMAKDWLSS